MDSSVELCIRRFGKEGGRPGPRTPEGLPGGRTLKVVAYLLVPLPGHKGPGRTPLLDAHAPFYRSLCGNVITPRAGLCGGWLRFR